MRSASLQFHEKYAAIVGEVRAFCIGLPSSSTGISVATVWNTFQQYGVNVEWPTSSNMIRNNVKPLADIGILSQNGPYLPYTIVGDPRPVQALAGHILHYAEQTVDERIPLRQRFGSKGTSRSLSRSSRVLPAVEPKNVEPQYLSILLIEMLSTSPALTKTDIYRYMIGLGFTGHRTTYDKFVDKLCEQQLLAKVGSHQFAISRQIGGTAAIELAKSVTAVRDGEESAIKQGIDHAHRITLEPTIMKPILLAAYKQRLGRPKQGV